MIKRILLLFLLTIAQAYAQNEAYHLSYQWDGEPNYTVSEASETPIMAIKDKTITEFIYDEEGKLLEYYLQHKVYWLNSDEKIEEFNKIYLPYSSDSELLVNKARAISKEGVVNELDDSKILTATDEETKRTYKYYAFEGIEKGSFIEYYYVVKKSPSYGGKRLILQGDFDKTNVSFELFAPKNLLFKFKSYNDLLPVKKDTLMKSKSHWKLEMDFLEKLEEEELSAYEALRKSLVYKLDINTANNKRDIISYSNVSQNLHNFFYSEQTKKEKTALTSFINDLAISQLTDNASKIRKIDHFIKSNFYVSEVREEAYEDINEILKNKVADEDGIIKLYVAIFTNLNIKHELVLTTDRSEFRFDKEFEASNFLTNYLIHFPKLKKFMSPTDIETRFGYPPVDLTNNYGLFMKEVNVGGFKSAVGKIKFIPSVAAVKSFDNIDITVNFNKEDLTKSNIKLRREMGGYYASYIQPYINLAEEKQRDELLDDLIKFINPNLEIIEKETYNDQASDFGTKPFIISANLKSEDFIEKAGNRYLFKVGELIGPQSELYVEKKRKLPVDNGFNRMYGRIIKVNIPDGYSFKNLDKLNIDNKYVQEGKEILIFNSSYTINENQLIINIDERYDKSIIESTLYDEYRKIINSAADFNKIVLILQPN